MVAVAAINFVLQAGGGSEESKSQHNADVLFSAFTGQAANSSGGISNGAGTHKFAPLQGQPTPRAEMARAIAAFTATGYTPMTDATSGQSWCSLDSYPPSAYLPGAAPPTVGVTCTWSAERSPHSTASIAIEVAVPTGDLHATMDSRGYLEPNVGFVVDLPLHDATVVVSASE